MSDETHISETVSAGQLRAFIERIERVEEEIKTLNGDKSDIYKELRACGFDVKAVRQCVAARKLDSAEREERTAIFEMYWNALTGASRTYTREARVSTSETNPDLPPHDEETGEIIEQSETAHQSEQPCTATGPSAPLENASDTISSINSPPDHVSEPAVAKPQDPQTATADQSSRAPVETDPLHEQADVKMAGTNPRETRPSASVALTNQQPGPQSNSPSSKAISSPLTKTAGDVAPLASPATNSEKPNCLKLKNGHCRIGFETSALCATCNAERLKRRVA